MRPVLKVTWVVLALWGGSALAADPQRESCCACLPSPPGAMSGQQAPVLTPALFCALITDAADEAAFDERCDALSGTGICVAPIEMAVAQPQDNLDCDAVLADALNVDCPAAPTRPAPLLGYAPLAGLGALLAALGMWAAGRRRRPSRS
jgi:hypothetical protein